MGLGPVPSCADRPDRRARYDAWSGGVARQQHRARGRGTGRALGEGGKARDLLKRAVELDPLEATYWWQLGEVTEDADPSEGERIKKLALELDPSVDDNVIDFGGLENSDG